MRESMAAAVRGRPTSAAFLLRRWPWLMVAVLSLASLLTLLLSDRSLRVLVPALFAVHATIITVGIRRRPDRDRVTWMALQIATILLVPPQPVIRAVPRRRSVPGMANRNRGGVTRHPCLLRMGRYPGFSTVAARSRHRPTG